MTGARGGPTASGCLGQDGLTAPCGPTEGFFAEHPMAALVLHISRDVIHHGAEIALLRDLHIQGPTGPR
jgi:biotin transporter BioY